MEIPLNILRDLIFDTKGINWDYKEAKDVEKYIPISDILQQDNASQYFFYDIENGRFWQVNYWLKDVERQKQFRVSNDASTKRYKLEQECLRLFARGLYNLTGQDRETGIALGGVLLRKKAYEKFKIVSGVDLNDSKWKELL